MITVAVIFLFLNLSLYSRINNRDVHNTCPIVSVCFCNSRQIYDSSQVC